MSIYFAVKKNKKPNTDKMKFKQVNIEVLKNVHVGLQGDYERTSRSSSQQPPHLLVYKSLLSTLSAKLQETNIDTLSFNTLCNEDCKYKPHYSSFLSFPLSKFKVNF